MAKYFTREEAEKLSADIKETYGLYTTFNTIKQPPDNPENWESYVGIWNSRGGHCISTISNLEEYEALRVIARVIATTDAYQESIKNHEKDGLIEREQWEKSKQPGEPGLVLHPETQISWENKIIQDVFFEN